MFQTCFQQLKTFLFKTLLFLSCAIQSVHLCSPVVTVQRYRGCSEPLFANELQIVYYIIPFSIKTQHNTMSQNVMSNDISGYGGAINYFWCIECFFWAPERLKAALTTLTVTVKICIQKQMQTSIQLKSL